MVMAKWIEKITANNRSKSPDSHSLHSEVVESILNSNCIVISIDGAVYINDPFAPYAVGVSFNCCHRRHRQTD